MNASVRSADLRPASATNASGLSTKVLTAFPVSRPFAPAGTDDMALSARLVSIVSVGMIFATLVALGF